MAQKTIAEALREAIAEEMRRDERVFCIGEDIGIEGGVRRRFYRYPRIGKRIRP